MSNGTSEMGIKKNTNHYCFLREFYFASNVLLKQQTNTQTLKLTVHSRAEALKTTIENMLFCPILTTYATGNGQ